jgi:hypothetical protein
MTENSKNIFLGALSLVGSVIMIFTPDHVDKIIEGILAAVGATKLTVGLKGTLHDESK